MHRRRNDMIRCFAIELLNIFTEICLHAFNTILFEVMVEMYLFGDHALAFHERLAVLLLADTAYCFKSLLRILCPNHFSAAGRDLSFKFLEVTVEVLNGIPFPVL